VKSSQDKHGYRVELVPVTGFGPMFKVTTPEGKTFHAESRWGVRRIIRQDKYAVRLNHKEQ
jgi:hypothetical protein